MQQFTAQPNPNYRPDSIYTRLRTALYNNGLFEDQADAVLSKVVNQKDSPMQGRWNDPASDYPPIMLSVLMLDVNASALEWIDNNAPRHWARPLFTPNPDKTLQIMEAAKTDPKIKNIVERLDSARKLAQERPQTPGEELVAKRRLRSRQKAFDRLDIDD